MIEFRYWHKDQARDKYQELLAAGRACNMSCDGRACDCEGVMKTPRTNDITKGELIATLILWCFVMLVTGKVKGWW